METAFRTKAAGAFILPVAFLLLSYAFLIVSPLAREPQPLPPALQGIWLPLHVIPMVPAYAAFAVAAGGGMLFLLREREPPLATSLPSLEVIEEFNFWAVAWGVLWMTGGLITGAIWAQMAWGSYWSWDIKETWALLTWLLYILYLHGRVMRGWRGRPLALLSVAGFLVVLFAFLGLGRLARWVGLESMHVF